LRAGSPAAQVHHLIDAYALSGILMKTCLVIDDSEIVRKVARYIFEHLKFETSEAETCQDALDSCAKAMPDAILLDSHIPPMPTATFLASLRGLAGGDKPFVMYCATENDSTEIARALSAGADDYIMKPFDRETVTQKLAAIGLV
jgi:two-component system chemotaxis response regulator CheY